MPPQYFLYPRIDFLATDLKRANKISWVESGEKECVYIKDWFKPIFRSISNLTTS
jgi:hypothetical protein